jgi:hypothetical protein
MNVRSTVISEPVRSSGFRYGYLGKTTKIIRIGKVRSEVGGGRDKRVDRPIALSVWPSSRIRATFPAVFVEWISIGIQVIGLAREWR